MKSFYAILASVVLYSSIMFSQTIVPPGNVSGTWTSENSPYIVTGNISVSNSLLIQPGVTVQFQAGGWAMTIGSSAKLVAKGTATSRIVFEPYQGQYRGLWRSLYFENSGTDDTLQYCTMSYGTYAIFTYNSKPLINECTVSGDSTCGIYMLFETYSTSAYISNCKLYDNRCGIEVCGYGKNGNTYDTVQISGCLIYGNEGPGIRVSTNTYWNWDYGYMLARISNCTVYGNLGEGILASNNARGNPEAALMNSIVAQNSQYGIANGAGGLTLANNISYNCFKGNSSGDFSGISIPPGFGEPGPYQNTNGDSCDLNFNIYFDPLFVNPLINDYNLQSASKCIDAGTNIVFGHWVMDPDNTLPDIGAFYFDQLAVISDRNTDIPKEFSLLQNYPNPFNPTTKISWQSPVGSWQTLKVYDVMGREVATLVNEYKPAGSYEVEFNAISLPSGVYFYRLQAGSFVETKKMILLR
jgi:hypothetical protein